MAFEFFKLKIEMSLVKVDPVVLEKKSKMYRVYRHMNGQKTNGRQARSDLNSSLELSAQVNKIRVMYIYCEKL